MDCGLQEGICSPGEAHLSPSTLQSSPRAQPACLDIHLHISPWQGKVVFDEEQCFCDSLLSHEEYLHCLEWRAVNKWLQCELPGWAWTDHKHFLPWTKQGKYIDLETGFCTFLTLRSTKWNLCRYNAPNLRQHLIYLLLGMDAVLNHSEIKDWLQLSLYIWQSAVSKPFDQSSSLDKQVTSPQTEQHVFWELREHIEFLLDATYNQRRTDYKPLTVMVWELALTGGWLFPSITVCSMRRPTHLSDRCLTRRMCGHPESTAVNTACWNWRKPTVLVTHAATVSVCWADVSSASRCGLITSGGPEVGCQWDQSLLTFPHSE